jgi:hypothetical protein
VREAIERRGAILLYLPAYSPDLNPIEQMFSKLKSVLRKVAAYTLKAAAYSTATLCKTIAPCLNEISQAECVAYLAHSGYGQSKRKTLYNKSSNLFPFGEPRHGGDYEGLSDLGVLLCLVGTALALIGDHFLVMKLIDMSRLEDCMLSFSKILRADRVTTGSHRFGRGKSAENCLGPCAAGGQSHMQYTISATRCQSAAGLSLITARRQAACPRIGLG